MAIENERIKIIREKEGLSQAEFAEKIGKSTDLISKMERGSAVSIVTAKEIATVFGVTLDYLFGLTDQTDDYASRMMLYLKKLFQYERKNEESHPIIRINKPVADYLDGLAQAEALYRDNIIPEAAYLPWVEKLNSELNSKFNDESEMREFYLIPVDKVTKKYHTPERIPNC